MLIAAVVALLDCGAREGNPPFPIFSNVGEFALIVFGIALFARLAVEVLDHFCIAVPNPTVARMTT
jgi:hypothetical protein